MLEDKIRHKKNRIKSHEIRVYLGPEYDPGIKAGALLISKNENHLE